ncbi:MAG TPA: DUF1858 domain-containing protein [bacterium]|nr:DUF1858 domain-containing protein [bacterium]HOH06537.1 DUF1858 domain-containing protein [bacterium]
MINRDTLIEDLVREHPEMVRLLMDKGVRCLACGEPVWGTIAGAAAEKGFNDARIDELVQEINQRIGAQ